MRRLALVLLAAALALGSKGPGAQDVGTALPTASRASAVLAYGLARGYALEGSAELAQLAASLETARAALAAAEPYRSSTLSASATLPSSTLDDGFDPSRASAGVEAAVPVTSWFGAGAGLSVDMSGGLGVSASLSFSPFATSALAAKEEAYRSALLAYRAKAVSLETALRGMIRTVEAARAKAAWKRKALESAEAAYEQARILVERGEARRSEGDEVFRKTLTARSELDEAEQGLAEAETDLALAIGREGPVSSEGLYPEVVEACGPGAWLAASSEARKAQLELESARRAAAEAGTRPSLAIEAELDLPVLGEASPSVSASASLRLPLETILGEDARLAAQVLEAKDLAYRVAVSQAVQKRQAALNALARLSTAYEAAKASAALAALSLEEASLLFERGDYSRMELLAAEAASANAAYNLSVARANLAAAVEALDPALLTDLLAP